MRVVTIRKAGGDTEDFDAAFTPEMRVAAEWMRQQPVENAILP